MDYITSLIIRLNILGHLQIAWLLRTFMSIHDKCCKLIGPSLLPDKDKTIAKMCEECITHTELNAHQISLI